MNRQFKPISKLARSILAVAALLTTVGVSAAIDDLAFHYRDQGQAAANHPAVYAQR